MNPSLNFLPMTEAHLEDVLSIENQSFVSPWSQVGFEKALDQGLNYVFENVNGQLVGYACVLKLFGEVELLKICIAPAFRGQGLGEVAMRLLISFLSELAGIERVLLEVRVSNASARGLYQKMGFKNVGLRKGYYAAEGRGDNAREDAVLMSRNLP